jgi:hypothetical protein
VISARLAGPCVILQRLYLTSFVLYINDINHRVKIMKTKQNKKQSYAAVLRSIIGVCMLSIFLIGCNNDDEQSSTLHVRLTDAPADFQEVNIDIQGIEVHGDLGEQTSGWKQLTVAHGVYNLLALANGLDTLLASNDLPAGRVSQIRLILGSENTVKVDGVFFDLATPSGQQSGLKLNVNTQLKAGIAYTILLDFDAALSVVEHGNETYSLKPVIRALSEATSGAISGTVTPVLSSPAVFVIAGSDTLATAYTDDDGNFLLRGVPAGTYTVTFDPRAGYIPMQIESVNVTVGNVTSLGTVIVL